MSFIDNKKKSIIIANLKELFKASGIKASVTGKIRNYSHITVTIKSTEIYDKLLANLKSYKDTSGFVNYDNYIANSIERLENIDDAWEQKVGMSDGYYLPADNEMEILSKDIFKAVRSADWYDRSEAMIDYFDTAYYFDVVLKK